MAELSISGARKSYGNTEVIHGLDFGIEDGEFAVLVGPSGRAAQSVVLMGLVMALTFLQFRYVEKKVNY